MVFLGARSFRLRCCHEFVCLHRQFARHGQATFVTFEVCYARRGLRCGRERACRSLAHVILSIKPG
jgi:hypothetical protein